jgi:hypothetical protein
LADWGDETGSEPRREVRAHGAGRGRSADDRDRGGPDPERGPQIPRQRRASSTDSEPRWR